MTDRETGSTPFGSRTGTGSGGRAMPDGGERFCVACGKAIDPGIAACPECGTRQDGAPTDDDDGDDGTTDTSADGFDRGAGSSSSDSGSIGERAGSATGGSAAGETATGGSTAGETATGGSAAGETAAGGSTAGETATGGIEGGGGPTATATADTPAEGEEYCPECGAMIDRTVTTCPHCGADRSDPDKSPIIAGVLSLLLVGAGQVYIGQTKRGIVLFGASIVAGVLTLTTGVVAILSIGIWLYAGYDAYTGAKGE